MMTVGELKAELKEYADEIEVRVHVEIKGANSGFCVSILEVGHVVDSDGITIDEVIIDADYIK
jgi:hypothetical protein